MNSKLLKDNFYDPKIGYLGLPSFYQKMKKIKPEITFKEVEDFYHSQPVIQLHKKSETPNVFNSVVASAPGHMYEMDFIIYERYKIHNYKYIFCCIDIYSRYAIAIPTTNMKNETIIKCLEKVFKDIGAPWSIKCDNQFNTTEMINFCNKNDVDIRFTDANELNKNPIVERFNQTIERKLALYRTATSNRLWYKYLDGLMENYNNTIHRTTKNTPYDIFFKGKYNEQTINYVEPKYRIGDRVRIKTVKKTFGKGDVKTYSDDIYTVKEIKNNQIFLDGETKKYKPYEIKKVSEIKYKDDEEEENQPQIKNPMK